MNSSIHYENANFLCELAESLLRILPEVSTDKSALLQRLANEELARAEYDEQVRAKVAVTRTDKWPGMSTTQLRQQLRGCYQELRHEL
ncbi:plasmid stabilization protein [Escherichia coli]|uniref:plasmid stabilization protein n=1 Tax=Escherichia coli TaxID=562 RepID=UPI0038B31D4D